MTPLREFRQALAGKKTYGVVAFGLLYLLGCWAGWFEFDSKVLGAVGLGGLWTLAARVARLGAPKAEPPPCKGGVEAEPESKPDPLAKYFPPKKFPSDRQNN